MSEGGSVGGSASVSAPTSSGTGQSATPVADAGRPQQPANKEWRTSEQLANPTPEAPKLTDEWEYEPGKKITKKELAAMRERDKNLERGYQEKFRQVAAQSKQAQQALATLEYYEQHPEELFKKAGKDANQFAQQVLQKSIEEAQMTPDQRARAEAERLYNEEKTRREQIENEQRTAQEQAQVKQYTQHFEKQFADALTSAKMPPIPATIKRVAERTQVYFDQGIDVPAAQVVADVKADMAAETQYLLDAMSDEDLAGFLGKNADRIRKFYLSRNQPKPVAPRQPSSNAAAAPPRNSNGQFLTRQQLRERLDKRM
jgi:hypothetical protein